MARRIRRKRALHALLECRGPGNLEVQTRLAARRLHDHLGRRDALPERDQPDQIAKLSLPDREPRRHAPGRRQSPWLRALGPLAFGWSRTPVAAA